MEETGNFCKVLKMVLLPRINNGEGKLAATMEAMSICKNNRNKEREFYASKKRGKILRSRFSCSTLGEYQKAETGAKRVEERKMAFTVYLVDDRGE